MDQKEEEAKKEREGEEGKKEAGEGGQCPGCRRGR